jgi:hypothetical protein
MAVAEMFAAKYVAPAGLRRNVRMAEYRNARPGWRVGVSISWQIEPLWMHIKSSAIIGKIICARHGGRLSRPYQYLA